MLLSFFFGGGGYTKNNKIYNWKILGGQDCPLFISCKPACYSAYIHRRKVE